MTDQPTSGGSYIRQKSGELKLVQRTEDTSPASATAPAADTTAAGASTATQSDNKDA